MGASVGWEEEDCRSAIGYAGLLCGAMAAKENMRQAFPPSTLQHRQKQQFPATLQFRLPPGAKNIARLCSRQQSVSEVRHSSPSRVSRPGTREWRVAIPSSSGRMRSSRRSRCIHPTNLDNATIWGPRQLTGCTGNGHKWHKWDERRTGTDDGHLTEGGMVIVGSALDVSSQHRGRVRHADDRWWSDHAPAIIRWGDISP